MVKLSSIGYKILWFLNENDIQTSNIFSTSPPQLTSLDYISTIGQPIVQPHMLSLAIITVSHLPVTLVNWSDV